MPLIYLQWLCQLFFSCTLHYESVSIFKMDPVNTLFPLHDWQAVSDIKYRWDFLSWSWHETKSVFTGQDLRWVIQHVEYVGGRFALLYNWLFEKEFFYNITDCIKGVRFKFKEVWAHIALWCLIYLYIYTGFWTFMNLSLILKN